MVTTLCFRHCATYLGRRYLFCGGMTNADKYPLLRHFALVTCQISSEKVLTYAKGLDTDHCGCHYEVRHIIGPFVRLFVTPHPSYPVHA